MGYGKGANIATVGCGGYDSIYANGLDDWYNLSERHHKGTTI